MLATVTILFYPQVTLDIVHADTVSAEEQNSTETAKTYKVNCDKRNITGAEDFAVQVLNVSQVSRFPGMSPYFLIQSLIQISERLSPLILVFMSLRI